MYFETDTFSACKERPVNIVIGGRGCGRKIREYLNSLYGKEDINNGSKNNSRTDGNGKKQNR